MAHKKSINKKSDEIGNSAKLNYSEDASQDQPGKSTRRRTRNLPSAGEYTPENQHLRSGRSAETSSGFSVHTSTLSSPFPNKINQLHKASSSADISFSSQELRSRTNCSRSVDTLISPLQNPTASSTPIIEHSEVSGSKCYQRDQSSLREKRDAYFASFFQRGGVSLISSISKNPQKNNILSPEKRSVEMDATCTHTRGMKEVPESSSLNSKNESYRSKLRLQAAAKNVHEFPTYLQTQVMRAAVPKNEESVSLTTPSIPSKRKRKIMKSRFLPSKTANVSCKLNSRSSSSAANIVHKSPTNLQTLGSKVVERNIEETESSTEGVTHLSSSSPHSNSLVKHSNPEDLHQTGSFLNLPADKRESTLYLNELIDASTNSNLEQEKLEDSKSASDASAESVLPNLPSKEPETVLYPTTLTDAYLFSTRNDPGKQKGILLASDVLFEACQPDLPENEPESALHPLKITDKASSSDLGRTPKSRNSTTGNCESCIKIKKTQNFSSVSPDTVSDMSITDTDRQNLKPPRSDPIILNPHLPPSTSQIVDSGIETRKLKKSLSSPILNPHFTSSCHLPLRKLPLRSNSPVINVNRVLKFDTCVRKERTNRNQSDSSVGTSSLNRESRSQSKESSTSSRGMHRRCVSDEILTSKKARHDRFNLLLRSQSKGTSASISLPEIIRDVNQTSSVLEPLFERILPRSTSNTTSALRNILEFKSQFPRSNQSLTGMTEFSSFNEASNGRREPEVQMQQNGDGPLLKGRHTRSISSEISRNRPMVGGGINSPYIDVFKGKASISRRQPVVKNCFSADGESCSSSDVPHCGKPWEKTSEKVERFIPSRADRCPEYACEAQVLLQSVLREIMLFNEEGDKWKEFAAFFNRVSKSSSEMERMNLYTELIWYLAQRGYRLWHQNLLKPSVMTAEIYALRAYEILTTVVVTVLGLTLMVQSGWDFDGLFLNYESFRDLYDSFPPYSENNNVECMEDEASRNHSTTLKKMTHRLLLVTLTAFRLLLMYVGENVEESKMEEYEKKLSKEDKTYLRRS